MDEIALLSNRKNIKYEIISLCILSPTCMNHNIVLSNGLDGGYWYVMGQRLFIKL
jgi:hypothetical protein